MEIDNKTNLKLLIINLKSIKDSITGFIIPLKLLDCKDPESLLESIISMEKRVILDSDSWRFTNPLNTEKIQDEFNKSFDDGEEISTDIKLYCEAFGVEYILNGWIETIYFNNNLSFIDDWLKYQSKVNKILKFIENSIQRDLTYYLFEKEKKKYELDHFTLPYIPILKKQFDEETDSNDFFETSLACNLRIIEESPLTFSKKNSIPIIAADINSWQDERMFELLEIIDKKFKDSWVWFIDFSEFSANQKQIKEFNEICGNFIQFRNVKWHLRYGGIYINRFIPEIFKNICVKTDGWAQRNFSLGFGRRTRRIFHPQYGEFISEYKLLKYPHVFQEFNCNCQACKQLKSHINFSIPELLEKRREIQDRKKKGEKISLGKEEIGLSEIKQLKILKEHALFQWVEIQKMSDAEFNKKLKSWKGETPKNWRKAFE